MQTTDEMTKPKDSVIVRLVRETAADASYPKTFRYYLKFPQFVTRPLGPRKKLAGLLRLKLSQVRNELFGRISIVPEGQEFQPPSLTSDDIQSEHHRRQRRDRNAKISQATLNSLGSQTFLNFLVSIFFPQDLDNICEHQVTGTYILEELGGRSDTLLLLQVLTP